MSFRTKLYTRALIPRFIDPRNEIFQFCLVHGNMMKSEREKEMSSMLETTAYSSDAQS